MKNLVDMPEDAVRRSKVGVTYRGERVLSNRGTTRGIELLESVIFHNSGYVLAGGKG